MNAAATEEKRARPILRLLSRLASLIWWCVLAVLVLLALYAGLGRQVTQNINDYRSEIENQLSARLGQDVRIDHISSRWTWLNPTFIAQGLVIRSNTNDEEAAGSLQSMRVGLDFLASLTRFRIVFSNFEADGLELVINQTPRGEVTVEGVDVPEPVADNFSEWIDKAGRWLSNPRLRITRIDLGIRDANGRLTQVEIPQLDLIYRQGLFHASGRAMRPGTTEQLASFELAGQHFFQGQFTGQFYGDINSGRLFDGLMQEYAWQGISVEGVDVGGEVWLTFDEGRVQRVNGTIKTPYLQLGSNHQSLAPLENIRARFGWHRHPMKTDATDNRERQGRDAWYKNGEFYLKDLAWNWDGQSLSGLDLRFETRGDGHTWVADGVPIAPIRELVTGLKLVPEDIIQTLRDYRPTGKLKHMLLITDDAGFRLSSQLEGLGSRAFEGAPEIRGLDGSLFMSQDGGFVHADSAELVFGFPELFQDIWTVRDFSADVAWRFEDEITRVYSDNIKMDHGPASRITGGFDLRMIPGTGDVLGLRVGVENGNADMLSQFVPEHLVNPGLYSWLTTAIIEADITSGTYYGHGLIDDESAPGDFVSSMVYNFEKARVKYDERWPEVSDASGRVFVHEGRTRVDLAAGRTGKLTLRPGQVRVIPGDEGMEVSVEVAAPVSGEALSYWLDNSPLGDMAGAASDSLAFNGRFDLDLELGLALDSDQPPSINARVTMDSGTLEYPAADLQWKDLSGELSYRTGRGFSSEPLAARFLDYPVFVSVFREQGGGLTLKQVGRADVAALLDMSGFEAPGIDGTLPYEALLKLSSGGAQKLQVNSDLKGVAVDWPEPLGKPAETSAPIEVAYSPGDGARAKFVIDWPQRMNLDLGWQSDRVNLAVHELYLGQRRLQSIDVEAVRGGDNWLISADAEWIRGMVIWPRDDGRVEVDLEQLLIAGSEDQPEAEKPQGAEDPAKALAGFGFGQWPDIDFRIADLKMNDTDLGQWSFQLRPSENRLQAQNIQGQISSLSLAGNLDWRIKNGQAITGFRGTLKGGALADIGAITGKDIPFKNSKTAVEVNLDWPGRPDDFAVANIAGNAKVRFDDGVILEGNSTAQLFRIFNLLNSDTFWRRLQLDFTDLYEAGIAFDAISGEARFDRGVLTLDPELQIVGPSGAFKFTGTTDMSEETLDMKMVVVLPLTQNLPLAALLLGAGAPVGGALFVLDKVLGDPLSKLTSATYSVRGTWEKPDVELERFFSGGE